MKKIIFIFIFSFIFIFNVEASSKFYIAERIPNMHIESIRGSEVHNGVPFILRRDDNEFVYCINPFDRINTDNYYNEYSYNDFSFNLTDEQLNRMNLIAYYGYNYATHTDLKWYGVTQFLIWKTLGLDDIYFTESASGGRIVAYEEEINEIESLVSNYYILPSFSNSDFKYTINSNYEVIDSNGVLSNYEIIDSNIESRLENNKLYINTKDIGNYQITFKKSSPISRNYLLYSLPGSQSLLYPGSIIDIEFTINIEVSSGSITINKKDSENKNREFANLSKAVYGVYKDDSLITEIETNEDGIAYISNLPLGKYYVKELKPSIGYKLDENIYEVELTFDNNNVVIESYEDIIKGNIILNKYYGEDTKYNLENGAIFDIYDINDNLIGSYETNNGKINENLDYGKYYAIQTKGIEGYSFVDKLDIIIDEDKDYNYNLYDNKIPEEFIIVDVPNTKKMDYHRLIPVLLVLNGIILIYKSQKNTTYLE